MAREKRERKYRYYLTDALKIISENIAERCGGSYLSKRFYDVLHPQILDTRTAEEIVRDVVSKICSVGGDET